MEVALENLIDRTLKHMEFVGRRTALPNKTIPVLWFGNEPAYRVSPVRILTMAINPSSSEMDSTLSRFPSALGTENKTVLSKTGKEHLVQAWNEYFEKKPYDWFKKGFGLVLQELDASYALSEDAKNRALHIDVATPIPTKDKWSSIKPANLKADIIDDACDKSLLSSLLQFLDPDLIISSCADFWMQCVGSQIVRNELFQTKRFLSSTHKLENRLHAGLLRYAENGYCLYGHFEPSPKGVFGGICNSDKIAIGRYLAALVNLGRILKRMTKISHPRFLDIKSQEHT